MEKLHLILGIIIVALGVGIFFAYQYANPLEDVPKMVEPKKDQERNVTKIGVLSGHEFDLELENKERIHAVLGVISTPEAREKVIQLINRSTNPRIVIKYKDKGLWVVDLVLTSDMV